MVDVPPLVAQCGEVSQVASDGVGAFQVLVPVAVAPRDRVVEKNKPAKLLRGGLSVDHDEEVAVAVHVRFVEGERAL